VQTTRLNVLDELYLHLNREEEPWSVQLEVRVEGKLHGERLRAAVQQASLGHPLARARLSDSRATDVRYHWEIHDAVTELDLRELDGADAQELKLAREEILSRTPALDRPGPFSLLLAHDSGGDVLVLNLHHAAGDGLSALRLMASFARAYGGAQDPQPAVDPLTVRDVSAMVGSTSLKDRMTRGRAALGYLTRGLAPPARVAPQGGEERAGYGFDFLSLAPAQLKRLNALRRRGATLNDVLLGALALSVRRWNESHGLDSGSVYLVMPVNLRPSEWRLEVVGNYASYVSVHLAPEEHATLEGAIAAAAASTRRIKDDGIAGLLIDLFDMPRALPTALKQRLQRLIPFTGNLIVDTATLSNLGRVESMPRFGDAGAVKEVWFSPPGRMPLGVSFGAATLKDRLFLTLRYRHPQFDAAAAAEFLTTFRRVVTDPSA
jgi:NRPS condensation-like uncharacterized protein